MRYHVPVLSSSKLEANALRHQWHEIVQSYSERTLTFTKDRLPAIAAMATRTQDSRPQDRYLAGLWRSSLCEDLMWFNYGIFRTEPLDDVIKQRVAFFTGSDSRIPSWSWASTQHPVCWVTGESTVLNSVDILDVMYSIDGPDVSGEILKAEITLRAPIVSLDCIQDEYEFRDLSSHNFELAMVGASLERRLGIFDGLLYSQFNLDDHGWSHAPLHDRDLFALFLVAPRDDDDRPQRALIVIEIEPGKRWIRLGVVDIVAVQDVLETTLWKKDHNIPLPDEKRKEHRKRYRMILEAAETRVITLV
jgi:hypothetical protein